MRKLFARLRDRGSHRPAAGRPAPVDVAFTAWLEDRFAELLDAVAVTA